MEYISAVWDCIGRNAGHIQIGIGLFAIWYAKQGYKKIKEQITQAYTQEQKLREQKSFELKFQAVNLLLNAADKNKISIQSLHIVLNDYETLLNSMGNKESLNVKEGMKKLDKLKETIKALEMIQESLYSKCHEVNKGTYSDWESISSIYKELIEATKNAHKYQILEIQMQDNSMK